MNTPGMVAKHAIIKPTCRTTHGDVGAFDEASELLKREYLDLIELRDDRRDVRFHLILSIERESVL